MKATLSSAELTAAIYEVALALEDEALREAYLQRSFHEDPAGLAEMRRLLGSAREVATFFVEAGEQRTVMAADVFAEMTCGAPTATTARPALHSSEGPGSRLGPYTLIRRLGEGGWGVVYEAEQEEPLRRRVAIKIIRLGMDTEGVIARFEVERKALALMDHPNIARVLDAGATAAGRPYFAMELVSGRKITAYCDERRLGIAQRLELFIQVCHAIQHAHQKGIIHRDIKPSNILITHRDGTAAPKVIDFGIAKAAEVRLGGETPFTAHDQFMGTPAYMSPEQVDMVGIDVDTRSDIYSLGVLLYELLTSHTPFDGETLAKAGLSALRQTLLEAPQPLPSQRLAAATPEQLREISAHRSIEPARLVPRLRGELDWIAMKAIEKNRNRRYQTVNSLAADVQRFLNDEAVTARPPGNLYLLAKFVRRNQIAVILSACMVISIVMGLGAATTLYFRERRALIEQAQLRGEAERARTEEARLRHQAQSRANISRAALLLSEGQVPEADALLRDNPLVSIEPSLEAAAVFRALGDWNATYGRWEQAVQCYTLLNQVNRLEDPVKILRGSDLLLPGAAMLEYGDGAAYDLFRREALKRYLPVRSPLQAEHLLKACLLTPADPALQRQLEETAAMCASGFEGGGTGESFYPAWSAFSIALYKLRTGDFAQVLEWGGKCLAMPEAKDACRVSMRCLMAVAEARLGHREAALEHLDAAHRIVNQVARSETGEPKPSRPRWFDWSVASILIEEAEREVGG